MPKSTDINKKIKNKNLNVKVPEIEYTELQKISNQLGMSLSSMVRMLIYPQLKKTKESGDPKTFLEINNEK